jgi:hypothetical protein
MLRSRCLCGDVTWEVEGPLASLSHCHCSRCRKQHGAPFASYAMAPASGFRLHGGGGVAGWESSPGFERRFCRRCGSAVPGDPGEGFVFVPAGNFDGDPGLRPQLHIFVASKAPWYEIPDALPRFDAFPPGVDAAVLPDRPRPPAPAGTTRGSCNCGALAFEYEGAPILCRNCHCGRCRRARSAAHASNLGVRLAQLRFTRGEDQLSFYKLPEARFFTQAFCTRCGGKAPRLDASRDLAIVPMGALDDDPGVRAREHIFVGSKAPWFEIADALPQYEEQAPAV